MPNYLPFNDALRDLRVAGNLLLHDAYKSPWAIEVPDNARLAQMLELSGRKAVLPFHMVRYGSFLLAAEGCEPFTVSAGEFVICTSGKRHRMSLGKTPRDTPLADALGGKHPSRTMDISCAASELVCGVFILQNTQLNPILSALPDVLHGSIQAGHDVELLPRVAEMLVLELDSGSANGEYTINRLMELFCCEAIRGYMIRDGAEIQGWFRGLADPKICEAMSLVHKDPAQPWSVAALASHVGISPSRFAARFREATGQSVISYVSQWRMHVATNLMQDGSYTLSKISEKVGYESFPAFSRAFKKIVGIAPSHWRRTRRILKNRDLITRLRR